MQTKKVVLIDDPESGMGLELPTRAALQFVRKHPWLYQVRYIEMSEYAAYLAAAAAYGEAQRKLRALFVSTDPKALHPERSSRARDPL